MLPMIQNDSISTNKKIKMHNELFKFIEKYFRLSEEEKEALAAFDVFREYKKGNILLKEGEYSNRSYFVAKGCIRCYFFIEGEECTTEFYTEGQVFNPLCTIDKQPSGHYIDCVEDSILSVGEPDADNDAFLKQFPRFESLCRIISEELLAKNQHSFAVFKTSSPEQRYQHLLESRPDLIQRIPQHQIASYLGMKPESLSRIRKRIAGKTK
jgi:CRP-like cAMP-binding protein